MRRWIVPVVALALGLALCSRGWAGSPTEEIRAFFASAVRILEDPETEDRPDDRFRAIQTLVREIFDFHEAARLSLGPDWEARTPAERNEFVRLFADLVERSFIGSVAARIRLADGVKVNYLGESIEGATATVRTTMVSRQGFELPFDYRMIEGADRWAVRDVVIDGMSLTANYRAQFARVIQASSYRELVQQIQAKVSGEPTEAVRRELAETTVRPVPAERPREDVVRDARAAPPPEPPAARLTRAEIKPVLREQHPLPRALPVSTASRPVVVPVVPVRAGTSYWVQVGAFKNLNTARQLASRLREEKSTLSSRRAVTVATGSGRARLARVRIGPFADRAAAAARLRELEARGYRPFIAEDRE